jgi:hypothetical protein
MMRSIIYFIFSFILFSCYNANKAPSDIIKPEVMKSVLWDVMRAQTLSRQIVLKDSTIDLAIETKSLTQKVFKIHKTDSAQFNKSYNWYVKHPTDLKLIFDSLYTQKERENNLQLRMKRKYDHVE